MNKKAEIPKAASLKKNTLFNTIGSLTYQGCLWLTTVLVVLLSGYYDSGILAFAMAAANMFNAIATYNMRIFQVSDIKNEFLNENYVAFRLITTSASFILIMGYVLIVSQNPDIITCSFVYMLFKADEVFSDVLYGIDQKGERLDYVGISQFIRGIALAIAFSLGLAVCNSMLIAIGATYIVCLSITVFYDIPHAARFGRIFPSITSSQVFALLKRCFPIVLGSLFMSSVVAVPRQYYGEFFSVDALGMYAAIATPAALVQAAARYVYNPVLVPLAKRWNESPASFLSYFSKSFAVLIVGVIAMIVILSIVGEPFLVLIFGEPAQPYTYLFPYVLISTGTIAITWFLTDILVICRDTIGVTLASSIAFLISLASMVPLISAFDMNGINFTIILATIGAIAVCFVRLYRTFTASTIS